jgi:hypothetical protein
MRLICIQLTHPLCSNPQRQDKASSYAALAFSHHLKCNFDVAIDLYHQALSRKPDDPFSSELLNRALRDVLQDHLFLDDSINANTSKRFDTSEYLDLSTSSEEQQREGAVPRAVNSKSSAVQSSMMTDDGLSLSVESGDVDMTMS